MNEKTIDQLLVNAYSRMTDWYILDYAKFKDEVSFSCTTKFNPIHAVDAFGTSGETRMVIEVKTCLIPFERLNYQMFLEVKKRSDILEIAKKKSAIPILVYINTEGTLHWMDLNHVPTITGNFTTQKKYGVTTKEKETILKHKVDASKSFLISNSYFSMEEVWNYCCKSLAEETGDSRYLTLDINRTENIN